MTGTSLTLSCIGAGRAGKTLCQLFTGQQSQLDISIQQILNSSLASASGALEFIGQGQPAEDFQSLKPANIWLIATPDDAIQATSKELALCGVLREEDIVFHLSGSLSSNILDPVIDAHYRASIHPVHSFANPGNSLDNFSGSACAVEGGSQAKALLTELFTAIGGKCFTLDADKKALYHAATVMACNNLISLLGVSELMLEAAGVGINSPNDGNPLQSLIENTVQNYFRDGEVAALTGPISRGDTKTVEAHMNALEEHQDWQNIYSSLGAIALSIAAQQDYASPEQLQSLSRLLARTKPLE